MRNAHAAGNAGDHSDVDIGVVIFFQRRDHMAARSDNARKMVIVLSVVE